MCGEEKPAWMSVAFSKGGPTNLIASGKRGSGSEAPACWVGVTELVD